VVKLRARELGGGGGGVGVGGVAGVGGRVTVFYRG